MSNTSTFDWVKDETGKFPNEEVFGVKSKRLPVPLIRLVGHQWSWSLMWAWTTDDFKNVGSQEAAKRAACENAAQQGWEPR